MIDHKINLLYKKDLILLTVLHRKFFIFSTRPLKWDIYIYIYIYIYIICLYVYIQLNTNAQYSTNIGKSNKIIVLYMQIRVHVFHKNFVFKWIKKKRNYEHDFFFFLPFVIPTIILQLFGLYLLLCMPNPHSLLSSLLHLCTSVRRGWWWPRLR